jgi:hypothetical protein
MGRSCDETNKRNPENLVTDPDQIPTKELMRRQRQAEYAKAKAHRRAERLDEKARKADEKAEARKKRDAELWEALVKAKDIQTNEEGS